MITAERTKNQIDHVGEDHRGRADPGSTWHEGRVMVMNCRQQPRAQRGGGLVEPAVSQRQGSDEDHQRMRKGVVDLDRDDPQRAVIESAAQQEQSAPWLPNHCTRQDRRQQRGREQQDQCDEGPGTRSLERRRHAAARERIGETRRPWAPDRHHRGRDPVSEFQAARSGLGVDAG